MNLGSASGHRAFLEAEYARANAAWSKGNIASAWRHLERAHIVAQTLLWPHMVSHWKMMWFAFRQRDGREFFGQVVRLALAPIGNLSGRLPTGNTGRANVSAFAPMRVPLDLQDVLSDDREQLR